MAAVDKAGGRCNLFECQPLSELFCFVALDLYQSRLLGVVLTGFVQLVPLSREVVLPITELESQGLGGVTRM